MQPVSSMIWTDDTYSAARVRRSRPTTADGNDMSGKRCRFCGRRTEALVQTSTGAVHAGVALIRCRFTGLAECAECSRAYGCCIAQD